MENTIHKDKKLKILIAYFSATGNTKKIAVKVKDYLIKENTEVETLDITSISNRKKALDISLYDALIFGFPVYSMRAPRIARGWLDSLDGSLKKCSVFFTYGGFGIDPAHYFIQKQLEDRNFELVSTAQFLGAHTFNLGGWRAVPDRPDLSDFDIAHTYASHTLKRFRGEDEGKLQAFNKPAQDEATFDGYEGNRFKAVTHGPSRDGAKCSGCGVCEKKCPIQVMDAATGEVDRSRCLLCLKCVMDCPDKVLKINDMKPSWSNKLKVSGLTEESINKLQSKVYF